MKKSNFIALILGTVGTVFFALGMCMALIEEWGMFRQGIVCGVIGLVVLLARIRFIPETFGMIFRYAFQPQSIIVALAVVGALLLGVGMCLSMVFGKMVLGIVIGLVGIVALLCLILLTKGLK